MLFALLLIILLGAVACLWNRGIWTASLTLVNVVFAGLLTMNFFEPVANLMGKDDGKSNWGTFFGFWLTFAVVFTVLRLATDFASRVRVRFPYAVDLAGALVFAVWTGWLMFCLTIVSLHVSPLPRTSLFDAFMSTPDDKMLGIGPDRLWLAFTRQASLGAFQTSDEGFDPKGDFVYKYAARRGVPKAK